jgi:DNA polymerase III subunit alpha, Gram-positive type
MRYVVFDCETTGLSPYYGDKICEIGAVKIEDNKIVDKYWYLVNPQREISYEAYMVNKITPSMLKNAPLISDILPSFLSFIEDSKLAAYNAGFDLSFLNTALNEHGHDKLNTKNVVDIFILAKKMLPDLEKYPLWNVAKNLGVPVIATHRALADAQLTAEVFLKLIEVGADKFLQKVYLDYAQKVKTIETAIRKKEPLNIRFFALNGDILNRRVVPYRIKELNGKDFLYFESDCSADSVALDLIEEVVL